MQNNLDGYMPTIYCLYRSYCKWKGTEICRKMFIEIPRTTSGLRQCHFTALIYFSGGEDTLKWLILRLLILQSLEGP